ncbi:MAG: hypothetical protein RLZZ463_1532 [Bacteroidota bacterium]
MSQTIAQLQEEIVEEFAFFEDWMQRYEHMIALGRSLPEIDPQHKDDDHLIKGCQSKVWVHAALEDEKLVFTADSDAIITRGIIALLVRVFSYQKPADMMPQPILSMKSDSKNTFPPPGPTAWCP